MVDWGLMVDWSLMVDWGLILQVWVFEAKEVKHPIDSYRVDALFGIGHHTGFGVKGYA